MVLVAPTPIPTDPEISATQLIRSRCEDYTKPRVEDFELSDIQVGPSGLNAAMYKGGYVRRNGGWELSPKKLGQSRARIQSGVQPGPSFASPPEAAAKPDAKSESTETDEPPVMASIVRPEKSANERTAERGSIPSTSDSSSNLEDIKTNLRDVAVGLGIAQKQASAMANFLAASFDIDDPSSLWKGLSEVSEIHPSMRKRFWRTWNSYRGVGITPELVETVEKQTNTAMGRKEPEPEARSKRYIAIDGEVVDCDPEDDSGMSFTQALQTAKLQNERHAVETGAGATEQQSVLSTALTVMSQNNQAVLSTLVEAMKSNNGGGNTELIVKLMETKSEVAEARTAELIRTSQGAVAEALKGLAEAIRTIAGGQTPRKSWLEELFTELPEAREKFFKNVLGGGDTNGIRIAMPGATGPDGQTIGVPLDAYMRIEELNSRKDMVKTLREGLPGFMNLGTRLVGALQTNAEAQRIAAERGISLKGEPAQELPESRQPAPVGQPAQPTEQPAEQPVEQQFDPETMAQIECTGCKEMLAYPKTAKTFGCPACGVVMDNPSVEQTGEQQAGQNGQYDPRNNPPQPVRRPRIRPIVRNAA